MENYFSLIKKITLLALSFFIGANTFAQTVVRGFVKDATTMEPLPFVSVYFNDNKGVMTGDDGSYSIETKNKNLKTIIFSHVGYKQTSKKLKPGKEQTLNVELEPSEEMAAVVIKTRKRGKYRNKNNPAVSLIEHVIENKEKNKITSYDFVQFQQYQKLALFLSNKPEKLKKNLLFKNYKFVLKNVDTTTVEGKALLPIYIAEELSDKYLRKTPEENKTIILGERQVNYGDFLDNKGIKEYLSRLYSNINIYENNIDILNSQFLSPIADMGPSFYRYYIRDTVEINGSKLIRLYFTPRNPNDLLFRGTMFITLDGNYGVQNISMTISKNANLNWTRELRINQNFEKANDGRYHVTKSTMMAEFSLFKKSSGGIFGERTVSYKNFVINTPAPDSIYNEKDIIVKNNSSGRTDSFWVDNRPIPLSQVESKAYSNIDSLRNMKSFKRIGDIFNFLFSGYIGFGKWELGNTNTFYSFNPVEGFRLKVGGRTTDKLSNSFYVNSYLAYGFKDEKFKYLLGVTYSFNHKSVYSYPLNYLKVSYQHETTIPGQELLFTQEDNFFLSFKRGDHDKYLYNKYFKADYVREFGKGISYDFTLKNWNQAPAGDLFFQKTIDNSNVQDITTTELSAQFRWAPNEQFYQKKEFRIPIINKYPVFLLKFSQGIKGLLNGEYNYQNIHFEADKRFYLSQLGYVDATLEGGYIFGQLPFPLLTVPHANQTYAFQDHSYNMMNFLEFVSDRFAASSLDFYFNGFFLNKIPLLKKLKLREVATFKILYGGIRDENNPDKNPDLLKFPTDAQGQPTTFALGKTPYIEASVGIANIFKLIRIDLVKRVTYLDHPDVVKWGLRTLITFNF
ncbi:MAG TPA: DUF5686 family protein [Hanamia sp.]|nr:DUF5686 family protein [Hanamia sp.]